MFFVILNFTKSLRIHFDQHPTRGKPRSLFSINGKPSHKPRKVMDSSDLSLYLGAFNQKYLSMEPGLFGKHASVQQKTEHIQGALPQQTDSTYSTINQNYNDYMEDALPGNHGKNIQ